MARPDGKANDDDLMSLPKGQGSPRSANYRTKMTQM